MGYAFTKLTSATKIVKSPGDLVMTTSGPVKINLYDTSRFNITQPQGFGALLDIDLTEIDSIDGSPPSATPSTALEQLSAVFSTASSQAGAVESVNGVLPGMDGNVVLTPASIGAVDGPATSTDNAIARYDGATGHLLQNSTSFVNDTGQIGVAVTPLFDLHIENATGVATSVSTAALSTSSGGRVNIAVKALPTANTNQLGRVNFTSRNGANDDLVGAEIAAQALGAWTATTNMPTALIFRTTNTSTLTEKMRVTGGGNVGIGQSNPAAVLHIKAGTTSASTAPIKLTSGSLMTTPEAGAIEFDGTHFYGTVGSNRIIMDNVANPTITAGGTTGNVTINNLSGTANFAAAATSLTVTNNTVTANSLVFCTVRTNDATATIKNVVPAAGSFVITLAAAATAETSVGFFVIN